MTDERAPASRWRPFIPLLTIALSLLPFLLAPVRARLLSPDGRGEFAFFQSSFIVISAVGALGARHAYYSFRGTGFPDQPLIGGRAAASAGIASAAVGIPLFMISLTRHSIETTILIAIAALAGPVHLFIQLQLARAQYSKRDLRVTAITGGPALWEFLTNVALIALNAMTVFWVSLFAMSTEAVRASLSLTRRTSTVQRRSRIARSAFLGGLWSFSIVGVTPLLVSNIDVLTYGALLSPEQLGLYAVAKLALTLMLFATLVIEGRFADSRSGFDRSQVVALILLSACAIIGGTAGSLLITPVFGQPYREAAALFAAMAGVGLLGSLHLLMAAKAAARRLPKLVTASSLTIASLSLTLSVVVAHLNGPVMTLAIPMATAYTGGLAVLAVGLFRSSGSTNGRRNAA